MGSNLKMSTPSHFRLGAIDSVSEEYVVPENAIKGCVYKCPECQNTVIFKHGKIKRPHFAHKASTNPCTYYLRPSESQLHKDAKLRLKSLIDKKEEIYISKRCKKCEKGDTIILQYQVGFFPKLEHSFWMNGSRKQADLAYINNSDEILFILEVLNTHHTAEGNRPEPYYELNAVDIINSQSKQFDCCRNWSISCKNCIEITKKEEAKRILQLEERRIQKEEADRKQAIYLEELERKQAIYLEEQRIQEAETDRRQAIYLEERRIQEYKRNLEDQRIQREKRLEAKKRKDAKNQQLIDAKYARIRTIEDTIDSLNQSPSCDINNFESECVLYITKIKKFYPELSSNLSFLNLKQIYSLCLEKNRLT